MKFGFCPLERYLALETENIWEGEALSSCGHDVFRSAQTHGEICLKNSSEGLTKPSSGL